MNVVSRGVVSVTLDAIRVLVHASRMRTGVAQLRAEHFTKN
jgi:hypothetical protein